MKILFSLIALAALLVGCITSPKPAERDILVTCSAPSDTVMWDSTGRAYQPVECTKGEPRPPGAK